MDRSTVEDRGLEEEQERDQGSRGGTGPRVEQDMHVRIGAVTDKIDKNKYENKFI